MSIQTAINSFSDKLYNLKTAVTWLINVLAQIIPALSTLAHTIPSIYPNTISCKALDDLPKSTSSSPAQIASISHNPVTRYLNLTSTYYLWMCKLCFAMLPLSLTAATPVFAHNVCPL